MVGPRLYAAREEAWGNSVQDIPQGRGNREDRDWAALVLAQPRAVAIKQLIVNGELQRAETLTRTVEQDSAAAAYVLRASIAARSGELPRAEEMLRRALAAAPGLKDAAQPLGTVLVQQYRWTDAIAHYDAMIRADPDEVESALWKAWVQAQVGDASSSMDTIRTALARHSGDGRVWLSLGRAQKSKGEAREAAESFRRAAMLPGCEAAASWELVNLKSDELNADDAARIRAALSRSVQITERIELHFALAELEHRAGRFETAFRHLQEGSAYRLQFGAPPGRLADEAEQIMRAAKVRTARLPGDDPSDGPIFIIGMPRAGTSLLEQILDSHSRVEGLGELPYMDELVREVRSRGFRYPEDLSSLPPDFRSALADRYLELASAHRRTSKAFFVDKMPSNWLHLGLIRAVFPNAPIIDARRHPLDCCFSNYRQHFARGHEFTYSLPELGRTYRSYLSLVEAFERSSGTTLVRVIHEELVEDPSARIATLLSELRLGFEESCLRFHDNERAVNTPSALQVRQGISGLGRGRWRPYDRWLAPLKAALGTAIETYPLAPDKRDQP